MPIIGVLDLFEKNIRSEIRILDSLFGPFCEKIKIFKNVKKVKSPKHERFSKRVISRFYSILKTSWRCNGSHLPVFEKFLFFNYFRQLTDVYTDVYINASDVYTDVNTDVYTDVNTDVYTDVYTDVNTRCEHQM